jgi:hypothetical protein
MHGDRSYELACRVACKCHVGRYNQFCRENCKLSEKCEGQIPGQAVV